MSIMSNKKPVDLFLPVRDFLDKCQFPKRNPKERTNASPQDDPDVAACEYFTLGACPPPRRVLNNKDKVESSSTSTSE